MNGRSWERPSDVNGFERLVAMTVAERGGTYGLAFTALLRSFDPAAARTIERLTNGRLPLADGPDDEAAVEAKRLMAGELWKVYRAVDGP